MAIEEAKDGGTVTGTPPAKEEKAAPEVKAPAGPKTEGGREKQIVVPGLEDDGDDKPLEPDPKGYVKLSMHDFMKRVRRETKKNLKEIFGTSDVSAIKAIKETHDTYEKENEERKRAEMTERQKLESDLGTARAAQVLAERRADRARDRLDVEKFERKVTKSARDYVHADKLDMVIDIFRSRMKNRSEAKKFLGKESEWFAAFVEKNEEFAKGASSRSSSKEKEREAEAKPANNGVSKKEKPTARSVDAAFNGKTFRPGQQNSMAKDEVREAAKALGVNYP